jgi:FkbM family methyltransferase
VSVRQGLSTLYGVGRSLLLYYGRPGQALRLASFYLRFVGPGDLAFDIGAHVGNRIRAWRRLGARVVAVEPQPALARVLRGLYGRDPGVSLVEAAVARTAGSLDLHLNLPNPTIATASAPFIAAAGRAPSFAGQTWAATVRVPALTLDALIARHGLPRLIKIDIEGYEAEALAGLGTAVPVVSVEFVPMARPVIEAAIDRLLALGDYRFNAYFGDDMRFVHPAPLDAGAIRAWLLAQGDDGPAGDVVASLDWALLVP